jgi:hypothetical protein
MSDAGLPKFVVIRAGKLSLTSISEKNAVLLHLLT